jgi:G:T-mismatch repair DNA endonuclease (very short patch repair protein)
VKNGDEYHIPETKYKTDGFCKETNTIYEFHGDYWHGNPEVFDHDEQTYFGVTFRELYKKTLEREKTIKGLGYKLIVMWENKWKRINKSFKILQKLFRKYKKLN